jgi:dTDP-4-dehydrorhamnose reductase
MFDFVVEIAECLGQSKNLVKPISTDMLNQKAPRPKKSGLDLSKSKKELNYAPSNIKSTLFLMEVDI